MKPLYSPDTWGTHFLNEGKFYSEGEDDKYTKYNVELQYENIDNTIVLNMSITFEKFVCTLFVALACASW